MSPKNDSPKIKTRTDEFDEVESIILELMEAIDRIDYNFRKAKDLILELARTLDESEQCERSQISRKIKEILKDKEKLLPSGFMSVYLRNTTVSIAKGN